MLEISHTLHMIEVISFRLQGLLVLKNNDLHDDTRPY